MEYCSASVMSGLMANTPFVASKRRPKLGVSEFSMATGCYWIWTCVRSMPLKFKAWIQ
jgi:hypothetical protein